MASTRIAISGNFGYAPPLLPDELLYSWLGRFALLNALGSSRDSVDRIFGSRTAVPAIDLPSRLQSVLHQLGDWLPFQTIDQLLDIGTLLPYHRAFLTEACYVKVREILIHGDGRGLKTLMGRVANRFGANPSLRFCAKCIADSVACHGSPYWARQHQLPGVSCCALHRVQLRYHPPLHLRIDRQRFIIPTEWNSAHPSIQADAQQLRFASLSQDLLTAALQPLDTQQRAAAYRHAAHEIGFRKRLGQTDHEGLAQAVRDGFDDFRHFEHRDRLLAPASYPLAWVRDLIERPARAVHPICHLLLIDFLFGSVARFAKACSEVQIETPAPKCQTLPSSLARPRTQGDAEREALLRDTSLSCRQVADLIDKNVTTVVTLRRSRGIPIRERRKSVSDSCIEILRNELASGRSPKSVAAHCGVSLSTVYRIRTQYASSSQTHCSLTLLRDTAELRLRWLRALSLHKLDGVTEVRSAAPAAYAWLYRYDRVWLLSTTLTVRKRRTGGVRLDWAQRDADCCEQVRARATALRNLVPPRRITKTQLLRPLGEAMFLQNKRRLPLLVALLDQISESPESFGIRRVDYAIATITGYTSSLKLWRIKRLAGLRLWPDALSAYAHQEIERLNSQKSVHIDDIS